jgi:hypothetical protein
VNTLSLPFALAAMERQHLAVTKIFGMHSDATPWTSVATAFDRFLTGL